MILPITIIGHPALRKVTEDIDENHEGLQELIANMFETMYEADGIGLAAPQVGKIERLLIIDATPLGDDEPELADFKKVFINAYITERSGEPSPFNEGCLSIPGIREDVDRQPKIKVEYLDENFEFHEEYFEGTKSRIVQHEFDHLEGVLFTDRLKPLKKKLIKGKLNAISKGKFERKYPVKLK